MEDSNLQWPLNEGETVLWQGRPAPRCYTFRHWLQATIGTILFFACSFWSMVGLQLIKAEGYSIGLVIAPLIMVVAAFFIGPGQLILSRLRWEKIFYVLTDQRLLVRNRILGNKTNIYSLDNYKHHKKKNYGKDLCSLRLSFQGSAPIILECLEAPENLLELLPKQ